MSSMRRIKLLNVFLLGLAGVLFFSAGGGHVLDIDIDPLNTATAEKYRFDFETVRKGPYLNLKSAILVNYDNGQVLYAKNPHKVRPIASISKLVTAMVVLDSGIDLDSTQVITREDAYRSSRSRLRVGTKMTLRDYLHSTLMCSDNRAARALARAVAGTIEDFADLMNEKVESLGLRESEFEEPSGLSSNNVSTAAEVAKILHYAHDYPLIAEITSKKRHTLRFLNGRGRRLTIGNTNRIIWAPWWVDAGKTGYIRAADYCLTTLVHNKEGERLTLVVLGVPGDNLRFKEARRLLTWGFRNLS